MSSSSTESSITRTVVMCVLNNSWLVPIGPFVENANVNVRLYSASALLAATTTKAYEESLFLLHFVI
jgi:hypothetical protein